jgi:hypothetical protein
MFLRHTYLVFDADNAPLAMAKAAHDPGSGRVSPSNAANFIAIPAGTGSLPGAVRVDPLPVPPSPTTTISTSTRTRVKERVELGLTIAIILIIITRTDEFPASPS